MVRLSAFVAGCVALCAAAALCPGSQAADDALPGATEARRAIERSLPLLTASADSWRTARKCVSCHHLPSTIWSLNEAKARGFRIDEAKLKELSAWSFSTRTPVAPEAENAKNVVQEMTQLLLAHAAGAAERTSLDAYERYEPFLAGMQDADGSWKEANVVREGQNIAEAQYVDVLWAVLGLTSLQNAGEGLSEKTQGSLAAALQQARTWLQERTAGTRADGIALRMLLEHRSGSAEATARLRRQLLDQQNADGGWGFTAGSESNPHVTGECLYALGESGCSREHPAVERAWKYLLAAQRPDGSWETFSRRAFGAGQPRKVNEITTHWGTAWATIGLLATMPPR
jgi:hypothetical protein